MPALKFYSSRIVLILFGWTLDFVAHSLSCGRVTRFYKLLYYGKFSYVIELLISMMWLETVLFIIGLQQCTPAIFTTEQTDKYYAVVGLFDSTANSSRNAFNESMRSNIIDRTLHLEPVIVQPQRLDSYTVWRELCSKEDVEPVAIFGPQGPKSDGAVRDQCSISNIPHIQATWQPLNPDVDKPQETSDEEQPLFKSITINFYPDSDEISMAHAKLLEHYGWKNFAALYEDNYGLMRIQKILAYHTTNHLITIRQFDLNGDNHKVFKELSSFQESRILLDCNVDNLKKYMTEANTLKMLNAYQHYIFTSLDVSMHAEDLIQYNANMTWLSLVDYDVLNKNSLAQRVAHWRDGPTESIQPLVISFKTEDILIDDVANHVLKSLEKITSNDTLDTQRLSCDGNEKWSLGVSMQNALLEQKTSGATGPITFDENGKRTDYTLYINEIHMHERDTIGTWNSSENIVTMDRPPSNSKFGQINNELIVISRLAKPYFYPKNKSVETQSKDDRKIQDDDDDGLEYEGYAVDLVKGIFKVLNEKMHLNYTFKFSEEVFQGYGKYDTKTKKWSGLIGAILDKKADLAVCDLTITQERKEVVDFSVPFMSLGISILFLQDQKVVPGRFSFLSPYTFDVWIYTATAYCVVSMILFICSRISPADWENPQPCDKDPEELENIWNFKNCTWLTMGSIMTQGCDILPKAFGSRWVCGMWWFFAMIVCQTYIAQLAAAMTSAADHEPINSVEELADQSKILYGALGTGSTFMFFKKSKDKMYQKMYENMISNPVVLVNDNDEGEKRVLKGKNKYAYFMESTTIDYKMKRNCKLKKVGGELDSKDYGIAMPANSPFRSHINEAILLLKEQSELDKIYKKWWEDKYDAKQCPKAEVDEVEGNLEMENLIGAFIVLIMGLAFCLVITAAEFMNEVRNIVVRENVSHKEAFLKELKASLNFFQLQKPILRNLSRAPSIENPEEDDSTQLSPRQIQTTDFLGFEKLANENVVM